MDQQQSMFQISLTGGPDGRLRAAYIHVRKAKVARTKEVVADTLLADYDSRDRLVGIEILGPVSIQVLTELVDDKDRAAFERFAEESIPESLLQRAA
jgi:uncharacterized protein YuzE